MYSYRKITVTPGLPDRLSRLKELAYNVWWAWNPQVRQLFSMIDEEIWLECRRNPITFMQKVSQESLERAAEDPQYLAEYERVLAAFDHYMKKGESWFTSAYPQHNSSLIAYFSAEYGLHEVLPLYSGGLGVLSGDHCKTASDLGLPFVAVGLLYQEGYFDQVINRESWPESHPQPLDFHAMPIHPVLTQQGQELVIDVDFPGRKVYAKIWEIKIGRISLYLMDTNIPSNDDHDKYILKNLYGGDLETRLCQEILLGIGGSKTLHALGYNPTIIHMNEGHCSFAILALLQHFMKDEGLPFAEALEAVASSTAFTTHTPVPAGTDIFPSHLMDKYFQAFYLNLGISRRQFLGLGLSYNWEGNETFNMTVLGLRCAGLKNGVSRIHGMVSRNIFQNLWPSVPEEEIPITHITNGIHLQSWLAPEMMTLIKKVLGEDWYKRTDDSTLMKRIDEIPDEELWNIHKQLKQRLLFFAQNRILQQKSRQGRPAEDLRFIKANMHPNALTLGFARRFATYKRATLIFTDQERLARILNQPNRPVQIIFAGKAHPADYPAQELIKRIQDLAEYPEFKGKILFIENYNMEIARHLVQGVDVWLNNPRKPLEASGTSGQKAGLNGCINFSILDGWWAEAYNGVNGWAIGDENYSEHPDNQDDEDSKLLYYTLEEQIIPSFFNRDSNGTPHEWIKTMKESIKTIVEHFITDRMLKDYTTEMYHPLLERAKRLYQEHFELPHQLVSVKSDLEQNWDNIHILPMTSDMPDQVKTGQTLQLRCKVENGPLNRQLLLPEIYFGKIGLDGLLEDTEAVPMKPKDGSGIYEGEVKLREGGQYGYTFRVLPHHPDLINPLETGLIKWADFNQWPETEY